MSVIAPRQVYRLKTFTAQEYLSLENGVWKRIDADSTKSIDHQVNEWMGSGNIQVVTPISSPSISMYQNGPGVQLVVMAMSILYLATVTSTRDPQAPPPASAAKPMQPVQPVPAGQTPVIAPNQQVRKTTKKVVRATANVPIPRPKQ